MPVCFVLAGQTLYVTVDQKRKRGKQLKRIRNILENPATAFVADRYDEDWSQLGWVMLRGRAEILGSGHEHVDAQALLRAKYPQYRDMELRNLPVIALRVERTASWGKLTD